MPDAAGGSAEAARSFYRDIAGSRPELLSAILRFNASQSPPADGGRVPELKDSLKAVLEGSARGRSCLARLGGAEEGFWGFEDELRRLALLEAPVLRALLLHFGAAVNARELSMVVRREEQKALRDALGGGLVDFALGRGAFMLGETRQYFLPVHADKPLDERVFLHGLKALGVCVGRWPETLLLRAERRFGSLVREAPLPAERDHKVERLVWFGLKKLLIKEVAPQWAPCFS